MSHKVSVVVLVIGSYIVAAAITPADPMTMLIALAPILILSISGYGVGFYNGSRARDKSNNGGGGA